MPDGPAPAHPPALPPASPRKPGRRAADAERTRGEIIAAAHAEFVEKGLSGASVNDIAARTRTSKPMLYYYFGSKEGLYAAVLEAAYGGMRDVELSLRLDHLAPEDALRRLVEVTFDYHAEHPDFVRLISIENIHDARHIAGSQEIPRRNSAVIGILRTLLDRGARARAFRDGLDPIDVHLLISATSFYRVSNRHTWAVLFGCDLQAADRVAAQRRMTVDAVLAYVRRP